VNDASVSDKSGMEGPAAAPAGAAFEPDRSLGEGQAGPEGLPTGFVEAVGSLWVDLRGAVTERARLLALELRLAGMTLLRLVVYAVIVAVLVVTAWLGLVGGIVAGLTSLGLHWAVALAIGIVINLAAAAFLVRSMVQMFERVGLPASLRSVERK
jgi:hypothetical protein